MTNQNLPKHTKSMTLLFQCVHALMNTIKEFASTSIRFSIFLKIVTHLEISSSKDPVRVQPRSGSLYFPNTVWFLRGYPKFILSLGPLLLVFKGSITNFVTLFLLFFDQPPTYSNAFAIILLMNCNIQCNVDIVKNE